VEKMRTKFLAAVVILVMTVCNVNANLIVNGDFEQGNTGFSTQYTYTVNGTYPNQYSINTNPKNWYNGYWSFGDHTTGNGKMLLIDAAGPAGGTTGQTCWGQNVAVSSNKDYIFSAWIARISSGVSSTVRFSINGVTIGTVVSNSSGWLQVTNTWNSGLNTTASIVICETTGNNSSGNDFALDDISFIPEPTTIAILTFGMLFARARKK
jgi:hypothetical protein